MPLGFRYRPRLGLGDNWLYQKTVEAPEAQQLQTKVLGSASEPSNRRGR